MRKVENYEKRESQATIKNERKLVTKTLKTGQKERVNGHGQPHREGERGGG